MSQNLSSAAVVIGNLRVKNKRKRNTYLKIHNASKVVNMIVPFDAIEISCIQNIMENGAFAPFEQMLHFP